MQYRVLGALAAVADDDTPVRLGGPKQRLVLALLLRDVGRVVADDLFIDALWPDGAPDGARHTLQTYVSSLRRILGDAIHRVGNGYLLDVERGAVDAHRFEGLVAESRARMDDDPAVAATLLREALALWHGDPYADLRDAVALQNEIHRLDQARLDAVEDRLHAELASGRHTHVSSELEALARDHPYRERIHELLMLALYRSGRQAEALRAYERARQVLATDLGLDPSPELQRLQQRILAQDPALLGPAVVTNGEAPGVIGGFELRAPVGRLGRAVVWRALQMSTRREVALTIISPHEANAPAFVRAFDPLAQRVALLDHPHLVPLLDHWRDPRGAYLVAPWVNGGSVREALEHGAWSVSAMLRLVEQVGAALAVVHDAGLVHGDVSAATVLVDENGQARLTTAGMVAQVGGTRRTVASGLGGPAGTAADVYGLAALAIEALTAVRPEPEDPMARLTAARSDLPDEAVEVLTRATSGDPLTRHTTVGELLRDLRRALGADVVGLAGVEPVDGLRNPYKGLRAFRELDAPDFHGRDDVVAELLGTVEAHRLVAVVGPSGSGKSSLVHAGLVPALRARDGSGESRDDVESDRRERGWLVTEMVPGAHPFEELQAALLRVAVEQPEGLLTELMADEYGMVRAAKQLLPSEGELVLIVDQFEELYHLTTDPDVRRLFLDGLVALAEEPLARVRTVLTLRADYFDRPLEHHAFGALVREALVPVGMPSPQELARAVSQPARDLGIVYEPGLVERIVGDVTEQPGALPLLQHALTELFERRDGHLLTVDGYQATGGVPGALGRRADELYCSLAPDARVVTEQVFLRLVTVDERGEVARRRARRAELTGLEADRAAIEEVIRTFGAHRLLSFDRDPVTRSPTVEVAHEALFQAWELLRNWIETRREDLALHRRLNAAVSEWRLAGESSDYLLAGSRLEQFEPWAATANLTLTDRERTFLAASRSRQDQVDRRRRRRRHLVMSGLTLGLVLVSSLAMIASAQRARADREADTARSREVAAEAANQLDLDPELGLLLAIEAYEIAPTAQAEAALRQALVRSTIRARLETLGADPMVEVSPDGTVVASWALGDRVTIWSAPDGVRLADLHDAAGHAPTGVIAGMGFSPDGRHLLASNLDGGAWIWSVPDGELLTTLEWPGTETVAFVIAQEGVGWTPDGSRVVVASFDGTARLFDPRSGDLHLEVTGPGGPGSFLARARFSPDGERIAVEGEAGKVRLLDLSTQSAVAETDGHDASLWAIKFSQDGSRLLTAGDDGSARLWDASTGDLLATFQHDSPVRDATIGVADTRVLTGDANGIVRIWDAVSGERLFELVGHEARVNQLRFDASGRLALTASLDGTARLWDVSSGHEIATMIGSTQPVVDAEFSPDGDFIVTSGDDARIWHVPQGAVSVIEAHDAPLHGLAFSPDGRHLVTGGMFDGTAHIFRLNHGYAVATLEHAPNSKVNVHVSPDGDQVVTTATYASPGLAQQPDPPRIWDLGTGALRTELALPADDPLGVCGGRCAAGDAVFGPDGSRVAVGGFDGRVAIFDARTGEEIARTEPDAGFVFHLDWSAGEHHLLVGAVDTELSYQALVIDPDAAEVMHRLPPQEGLSGGAVRFSADGRLAATTVGGSVRIHELPSERLVAELRHRGAARDAAFSSDGSLVVTASESDASIWDVASQRRLTRLPGPGAFAVAFTPDEEQIAVGGNDGVVRFYRCEVCQPVDELLDLAHQRVTRQLTDIERERFLGG